MLVEFGKCGRSSARYPLHDGTDRSCSLGDLVHELRDHLLQYRRVERVCFHGAGDDHAASQDPLLLLDKDMKLVGGQAGAWSW